ncbi:hypothetical protein HWV62_37510 [Athelia sp. TMB]|nr:hypothetical protein HWV62_37510 [Athelia sp. TMB]
MHIPNELWLKIFELLPIPDLFSAYSVNQRWRSLISTWRIDRKESLRLSLFSLALKDIDEMPEVARHIGLSQRVAYVDDVETTHVITIPEPYRTVLTEWPSRRPVPGCCWSDFLLYHATGQCTCRFDTSSGELCQCDKRVEVRHLHIRSSLLEKIRRHEPFDYHALDESQWQLFDSPPRLHTDEQNEKTLSFIRAHPESMWERYGWWERLHVRCLHLFSCSDGWEAGGFSMILDGPARGEIHVWAYGWYQARGSWRHEECAARIVRGCLGKRDIVAEFVSDVQVGDALFADFATAESLFELRTNVLQIVEPSPEALPSDSELFVRCRLTGVDTEKSQQIFEFLPIPDLFSAYSSNQLWRSLISTWRIDRKESIRLSLFSLALKDIDEMPEVAHHIGLSQRVAYVDDVETTHNITIPEPYRTVLAEWPLRRPVLGCCWSDFLLYHATGQCTCRFDASNGELCQCDKRVEVRRLKIISSALDRIRRHEPFNYRGLDEGRWQLRFGSPPRLLTDEQSENTLDFIRAHPESMWMRAGKWEKLSVRCLNLFSCSHGWEAGGLSMILDGPARGEIHAWVYGVYEGIEAKSYLESNYTE